MEFRHVSILVQSIIWNINITDLVSNVIGGVTGGVTLLLVVPDIWNLLNIQNSLF
jgi:hypothetical protein